VSDWSRDGTILVFASRGESNWDLWGMRLTGDRKPFPLRKTKFSELAGTLSPDGRFLAYQSNESGRHEVYVQEFPEARSKWQISQSGGREPFWRADGRELYFRSPDAHVMAVAIEKGPAFLGWNPTAAVPGAVLADSRPQPVPDRCPDGQRFLVNTPPTGEVTAPAVVVLNWTAALESASR
jgi:Tol biopolymer transport system component